MRSVLKKSAYFLLCLGMWVGASPAQVQDPAKGVTTIRRISLLAGSTLEVEIAASGPVVPRAQIITGPDRLVIDFPNAMPAKELHTLAINSGEVRQARVGIFSSNPPVTRVVLDLKSPQPYQLFPFGNRVVVKLGASKISPLAAAIPETIISIERPEQEPVPSDGILHKAALVSTQTPAQMPAVVPPSPPRVEVLFENGLLSIRSNKANLSEVLSEVHRRTGAEIAIPASAETEEVFTNLGPGAPKEVLASLLNGSHFNFIVVGSERDPNGIGRVVLTPKQGGAAEAVVYPCGTSQPTVAQVVVEPVTPPQGPMSPAIADEPEIADTPTQPMPEPPPNPPQQ
jgi:AMIN domain